MRITTSEKNRLKNQYGPWAVVTGASSGIGLELATLLAESGFHLLLNARRRALLEDIAADLHTRYQVEVYLSEADLSQEEGVEQLIRAAQKFDVGLLVAAAGFGTSGSFVLSSLAEELSMLQLNCRALLMLTHHFSRKFAARGKEGIILMSSMVSFQGVPYAAHYAATKAYVQSLGEALSIEMRALGVDVLTAAPGPVESGFASRANMQMNMTLKPRDVGIPILKALGRKSTILPGWLTKVLVGGLRTVPRWGKVRIMKLVMGGMTQHQRIKKETQKNLVDL